MTLTPVVQRGRDAKSGSSHQSEDTLCTKGEGHTPTPNLLGPVVTTTEYLMMCHV